MVGGVDHNHKSELRQCNLHSDELQWIKHGKRMGLDISCREITLFWETFLLLLLFPLSFLNAS